jgi:hypothetical protein
MRTDLEHPDSPFAGCMPQPVRCRWLSGEDATRADSAEVVRLLVDDARGDTHWPNDLYQRNVIREVANFLGPTRAVLATPAGMVTAAIPWPDYSPASLTAALDAMRTAAARLAPAPSNPEVLLGLDGCIPGEATPLQTVVRLTGRSADQAAVKLYPAGSEKDTLLGWALCRAADGVLPELIQGHRVSTRVGIMLLLVCHEAAIFSGRSRAVLKDDLGLRVRRHFLEQAAVEPRPRYALMATHWLGTASGPTFRDAARYLAEETGVTTVTTSFAPCGQLEDVARRFPVQGPNADRVVTLLVEDTWGEM